MERALSLVEALRKQLSLIPQYDVLTDGEFHQEFLELSGRLQKAIDTRDRRQLYYVPRVQEELLGEPTRLKDVVPPMAATLAELLLPPVVNRYLRLRVKRGLGVFGRSRP